MNSLEQNATVPINSGHPMCKGEDVGAFQYSPQLDQAELRYCVDNVKKLGEWVPRLETRMNDNELAFSMIAGCVEALVEKVFPEGPPSKARGERTPEEVVRLLKLGIRLANLKPMELLLCISFVAGYLQEAGTLTMEQSAAIQKIVTETY